MRIIDQSLRSGCEACVTSRRQFLAGCAACAAGLGGAALLTERAARAAEPGAKAKVRLVFTYVPSTGPIWPNIGYDFERRKQQIVEGLAKGCPSVEFLPAVVQGAGDAKKVLESDAEVDGYLVYMLGLWTGAPQVIAAAGRPTLLVDDLYGGSGEFLIANAGARRAGLKTECVSSSRFDDVAESARSFEILKQPGKSVADFLGACKAARLKNTHRSADLACPADPVKTIPMDECLKRLREATVLIVGREPGGESQAIEQVFGTKVVSLAAKDLHEAFLKADRDVAAEFADRWMRQAERVIEPKREDIEKSGAMYVAMQKLLKDHNAQAITVNCLGGFYSGQLQAYPCLGFCQLNDDGLVGACESDLNSTMTMLAVGMLTGRPGMISDPVIDTSKNQIIYAHCVAPTKVFGPAGPANAYHIRSHSEDRKGAALRSLLPLGQMTTTVEISPARRQMVFHQGKSMENIDEDMACRTKLAAEVAGDMEKLMNAWDQWGWHRVTFYGDLRGPVQELCKALKLELVEEA